MRGRAHGLVGAFAGLLGLAFAPVAVAQTVALAPLPAAAPPQPARPPVYGYTVVNVMPHDPEAFTQGLAIHDGQFLESTGRHPSSVRRVTIDTGEVLQKRELDAQFFGEGLTAVGDRVLTLTWQGGHGFVWDADDLEPAGTFSYAGEGWGLTHDETRVILSDGTASLRFLDPVTLQQAGSVPVTYMGRPLTRLNELEFIEGEVWANVWQTNFIVRIDPADGVVKGVVDLTGLLPDPVANPSDDVLNGIAWDAQTRRLFVTGKNWPKMFEITLTGPR